MMLLDEAEGMERKQAEAGWGRKKKRKVKERRWEGQRKEMGGTEAWGGGDGGGGWRGKWREEGNRKRRKKTSYMTGAVTAWAGRPSDVRWGGCRLRQRMSCGSSDDAGELTVSGDPARPTHMAGQRWSGRLARSLARGASTGRPLRPWRADVTAVQ